ncbi:hypothetical protein B0H14DRAFT_3445999 [Mycena olivaceomarginata]|nr:hypothetical protein B0H14DRAFT_3445999 [Mycena olivaceomarginata]
MSNSWASILRICAKRAMDFMDVDERVLFSSEESSDGVHSVPVAGGSVGRSLMEKSSVQHQGPAPHDRARGGHPLGREAAELRENVQQYKEESAQEVMEVRRLNHAPPQPAPPSDSSGGGSSISDKLAKTSLEE